MLPTLAVSGFNFMTDHVKLYLNVSALLFCQDNTHLALMRYMSQIKLAVQSSLVCFTK